MLLTEISQVLVDAFVENRAVLFTGAGISIGSGLPRAGELAFQLQNELFRNKFVGVRPSPDDPLQLPTVAQRYQLAFGRQKLNEFLLKVFQKDGLKPNEAHKLAVRLFQSIITTNFDRLLEDALREEGRNPIVVVRDFQLPTTSIPDRNVIYKIHGDIGTPDRIVVTQRDFTRVPLTEGIKNELRSILLTKTVIFLGYGLGDYDFLQQLEFRKVILGQETPKAYAIMPAAEKDPLFIKQCDEDNIDLISDTAIDFLRDLQEASKVQAVPSAQPPVVTTQVRVSGLGREYRQTICEEFKWIDFKGIPVLGGYLRVQIDQLFVSLSAGLSEELESESTQVSKRREAGPSAQASLFKQEIIEGKDIFDILKINRKLVILGDPGSGKTTLLRYVGYHLSLPEPQFEKIGLEKAYLPVYIPLREYAAFRKGSEQRDIELFIPELLKAHNLEKYVDVVNSALDRGEAILLLDGLDEVASQEERSGVTLKVQQFSAKFPSCRVILTSRKVGYPKIPIKNGVAHFIVAPLSDQEIQIFIDLWCKATEAEKDKQNLLEAIKNPRIRVLAENPLLITILARVYKAYRNLPERRAELYSKCVEALLTTWELMRDLPPVFQDVREANRILGPIALWIHRDRRGQFVTRDQLLKKLAEIGNLPREQEPTFLLTQIEERSGLLREVGLNQYAFTHLTFQEYYVAREIVSQAQAFRQLRLFLRNSRWQEVIILTAGLLDDLGTKHITQFLDSFVIKPSLPDKPKPLQISKLNLLVACLKDKVEPDPYIRDYVYNSLLHSVEVPAPHRITRGLTQLDGFSKTDLGVALIEELKRRISKESHDVATNSIVLGYRLFKEEVGRLRFLMFALSEADSNIQILGSAAEVVSRLLQSTVDSSIKNEVENQIKAMPFERRRKILASTHAHAGSSMWRVTVNTWTSPEERSTLPEELRIKE